jgi:hypothetical protein
VWRTTHLLHAEDGPWDLLVRLRRTLKPEPSHGLFDCFYCLSVWVALPFAWVIGRNWKERLLLWPALSGGSILLHQAAFATGTYPPATYFEDKESDDVLRQESDSLLPEQAFSTGA